MNKVAAALLAGVAVRGGVQAKEGFLPLAANEVCTAANTTLVEFENICIHSDRSGHCGTEGTDVWNVVLDSVEECQALCCDNLDVCAGYIWYEAYATSCCTGEGCHGDVTTPPSEPGQPCCWLKSAISPAHLWSNDDYCTASGVVYVPGDL